MWPNLLGPGWMPQLLLTIGVVGVFVGMLKTLLFGAARSADEAPDEIQKIWHQYEVGDLTRWEFDRLRRAAQWRPADPQGAKENQSCGGTMEPTGSWSRTGSGDSLAR